jgi:hypothetical protein
MNIGLIMMVASRAFRIFVFAILVLGGSGIWLLLENANRDAEKRRQVQQAEEYHAATAISQADLKLDDVKLSPAA